MTRTPKFDPPPLPALSQQATDRIERTYTLITPLLGGGVEPHVNDPVTPIRGTSVRGQLRFWWRAMCGGSKTPNPSSTDLHKREIALWGGIDSESKDSPTTASAVSISIVLANTTGQSISVNALPLYASFPLREQRDGGGRPSGAPKLDQGPVVYPAPGFSP